MTKITHMNNKLIFENQEYTFDDFHNIYAFSYTGERKWQIGETRWR